MSNDNILQTLVDCTFDTCIMLSKATIPFWKWLFDGWIQPEKPNLEKFINNSKLSNLNDEFPQMIKIYNSLKGTIYKMTCPMGLGLKDFEKYKDAIEIYMRNPIEIRVSSGYIEIEVITSKLEKIIPYNLPKIKEPIKIPVAESLEGTVYINFKDETPHALITGTTGSGKSITLRNILTSIISLYPHDIELILIDFKIVELSIFKNLQQVKAYANEVENAKIIIKNALDECHERYKLFESVGATNIYEYNSRVSKDKQLKYQFIVIEEFVMLLSDKKKVAMTMLKQLACLARASGQFLIITGQRFDNTVIDLVLRANIGCRLCHKMEDEANSKLILDTIGAEKLRGNGHMIIKQANKRIECQGYFIKESQIKEVISPYIKKVSNELKFKPVEDEVSKGVSKMEIPNKTQYENSTQLNDLSFLDKL